MGNPVSGVQPLAKPSQSPEDFFVETIVAAWGQNCDNLAPLKRKMCRQDLRIQAHQIFQVLAPLIQQGASRKDFQQTTQNFAMCLHQAVHHSSQGEADAETEKKMADLDKEIEALHLPLVQHHLFKDTSLGSYATLLAGPVAGGTVGLATSGIIGFLEKEAAMQVKDAVLRNEVNTRMGMLQARGHRIQLEEGAPDLELLAIRNPKKYDSLLKKLAESSLKIRSAEEMLPLAEAVAENAEARVAATRIFAVARTTAFTTAGAALGTFANVVLLLLAADDAE